MWGSHTAQSNGLSLFDIADMLALHRRQSQRARICKGRHRRAICKCDLAARQFQYLKLEKAKTFLAAREILARSSRDWLAFHRRQSPRLSCRGRGGNRHLNTALAHIALLMNRPTAVV